jgi:hypothetical protein
MQAMQVGPVEATGTLIEFSLVCQCACAGRNYGAREEDVGRTVGWTGRCATGIILLSRATLALASVLGASFISLSLAYVHADSGTMWDPHRDPVVHGALDSDNLTTPKTMSRSSRIYAETPTLIIFSWFPVPITCLQYYSVIHERAAYSWTGLSTHACGLSH